MFLIRDITNPEQLDSMFVGKLSLDNVVFSSALLYAGPNFKVNFCKLTIPECIPVKWRQKKYNAFEFCLDFSSIQKIYINFSGGEVECSPKVFTNGGLIGLEIYHEGACIVSCEARFLTLCDVRGFINDGVE